MRIGIDVSQLAYESTGVGNYLRNLVEKLLKIDNLNEYVFFASSLHKRKNLAKTLKKFRSLNNRIKTRMFPFPPFFLDFLWNRLHIVPIEWFIGDIDVFLASDWTQPPTKKAKSGTILYDLIIYKYPNEMHPVIVKTHKRRLKWVKKECDMILCISESTKRDAMEILGIEEKRLQVVYPGV